MLIAFDKMTLYDNIDNDTSRKGSATGDLILVQDTDNMGNNEFSIDDYNSLPLDENFQNYENQLKIQ